MKIFIKFYNFVRNTFIKVPVYLRGIVIFTIFLFIAVIINALTEKKYYYEENDQSFMILNNKSSNNRNNSNKNVFKGSLKAKPKVKAPTVAIQTKSQNNKTTRTPDSLKNFSKDNVFGNDAAPVVIVEFSSYSCPYCITFQNTVLDKIKTNYIDTNKVKYVKRIVIQKDSLYAVMLPYCIQSRDTKYKLISNLYQSTALWLKSNKQKQQLKSIASNNGMSGVAFDKCIADSKLANSLLIKQKKELSELKVNSTPTLFINGVKYDGDLSYESLSKVLDKEYKSLTMRGNQ